MRFEKLIKHVKKHGAVYGPWYTLKYEDGFYKFGWSGGFFATKELTPFHRDVIEWVITGKEVKKLSWLLGDGISINSNFVSKGQINRKPVYRRIGDVVVFRDFIDNDWKLCRDVKVTRMYNGFAAVRKNRTFSVIERQWKTDAVPLVNNQKEAVKEICSGDFKSAIKKVFPWVGDGASLEFGVFSNVLAYRYSGAWKTVTARAIIKKRAMVFDWVPMRDGFYRVHVPFDYAGPNPLEERVKDGKVTYEPLEYHAFTRVENIVVSALSMFRWTACAGKSCVVYDELSGYVWMRTDDKRKEMALHEGMVDFVLDVLDESETWLELL